MENTYENAREYLENKFKESQLPNDERGLAYLLVEYNNLINIYKNKETKIMENKSENAREFINEIKKDRENILTHEDGVVFLMVHYADLVQEKSDKKQDFKEQDLVTKTEVHFDFIDKLKILFGAIPEVTVKVIIPVTVDMYNAVSSVKMLRKTKITFKKDKPDYGYQCSYINPENTNTNNENIS